MIAEVDHDDVAVRTFGDTARQVEARARRRPAVADRAAARQRLDAMENVARAGKPGAAGRKQQNDGQRR